MDVQLEPLADIFRVNTGLLKNCLDGIDDATATRRPNDDTNSMAFVAAHLVDARYFLAKQLEIEVGEPFGGRMKDARSIVDISSLPAVAEIVQTWVKVSRLLGERFDDLEADELEAATEQTFPGGDPRLIGAIAFLLQHESYHIGQLGFIRRFFGHDAMSYEVP